MNFSSVAVVLVFACLSLFTPAAEGKEANGPDYQLWTNITQTYVKAATMEKVALNKVDYVGISKDPQFKKFIESIEKTNVTKLSQNETMALYINAYNAYAVKMVIDHQCATDIFGECGPISSIRDIGQLLKDPVWDKKAGTIGGKSVSLDDIEGFLRDPKPWKEDNRIHSAIVCASVSCPNLKIGSYLPENLDAELDESMKDMLHNKDKGAQLITPKDAKDNSTKILSLSKIFWWYKGDFPQDFSDKKPNPLVDYLFPYFPHDIQKFITYRNGLKPPKKVELKYFEYNWHLNGDVNCESPNRPCYPLWAFVVTLVGAAILIIVIASIAYCKRKRNTGYSSINT